MKPIWFLALLVTGACYYRDPYVSAQYSVGYSAPGLAYIGPGVQVVTDYDYPVFYSDGYYWRYDGGLWYRSGFYNRGWAVSYNVPYGVRGISRPEGYVRYHGGSGYRPNQNWGQRTVPVNPNAQAYRGAPAYRAAPPVYRSAPVNSGGGFRAAPSRPIVRDHR